MGGVTRVLVVDDDPTVREVLRLTLDLDGYEVVIARDGAEAMAVAKRTRPDIVLLDVSMPGLDGFEVCRRLKAMRQRPAVFMITAMDDLEHEHAAVIAGADGYLRKPFSPLELLALLQGRQSRRVG